MTALTRFNCEEAFRRLNDFLDRSLTPDERRLVEDHLSACAGCASEFRFEATVLDEVRTKLRRIDVPEDLVERVARMLEEARRPDPGSGSQSTL